MLSSPVEDIYLDTQSSPVAVVLTVQEDVTRQKLYCSRQGAERAESPELRQVEYDVEQSVLQSAFLLWQ